MNFQPTTYHNRTGHTLPENKKCHAETHKLIGSTFQK